MPIWTICGGNSLHGELTVQGAKNAVLPILAASLMGGGDTIIENSPKLLDVDASIEILSHLGCRVMQNGGEIMVNSDCITKTHIPHGLMLKMRSSVMFLGAILARCGEVRLSAPGGCELGSRPIDLHLKALRELGAEIEVSGGEVYCRAAGLKGKHINLEFPSVGATENLMLAACAAEGETVLTNAAREPEICDLQTFLNAKGARISGAGTSEVHISGVSVWNRETQHRVMPDRIAAATYLCCTAAAGGELLLRDAVAQHLEPVLSALRSMGCAVETQSDRIYLRSSGILRACRPIITKPYPGFPTDAQALLMAASLRAEGTSVFVENIFEDRFRHVPELRRLGADIRTEGRVAMVTGVSRLTGAPVCAGDLRGGAALVLAGLSAEGKTTVSDSGCICRGYENFSENLSKLGADVSRCDMPCPSAE